MHNRVRMVVASFLVKDLHLDWSVGARHFMRHLVDGDLASNQHGWQWTAGTGTDAAPYYRVFNPIGQGRKFDPDGDLHQAMDPGAARVVTANEIHEPWKRPDWSARRATPHLSSTTPTSGRSRWTTMRLFDNRPHAPRR